MARTVLRSVLLSRARKATETENSQHVTDVELQDQAAYGADEFYDVYTAAYGELPFRSVTTLTTVAGQELYDLPADFYQARTIMANVSGRWHRLLPYADADEAALLNTTGVNYGLRYQVVGKAPGAPGSGSFGDQLSLLPLPAGALLIRVKYLPVTQSRDAGGGDIEWVSINGFDEFVGCHLNWYILQKREQNESAAMWLGRKEKLERRIREKADARDTGAAQTVADVRFGRNTNTDNWPWDVID